MRKQSSILTTFFEVNPFRYAIGIDLSDRVVRAVQIAGRKKNRKIRALSERQIPEGVLKEGEITEQKKLVSLITDLLEKPWVGKFSGSYVTLSLPERKTFLKLITIPKAKGGDPTEVVRFEATNHIPMNLEEVYLDWTFIPKAKGQERDTRSVLVAAAPRSLVDSYLALFAQTKYTPVACELESLGLYRAVYPSLADRGASLVIDFGGTETLFMLANRRTILFTSTVPSGGHAMTTHIMGKLGVSEAEAEHAKHLYGLEAKRGKGKIRSILLPLFKPYQKKLAEIVHFYSDHFPKDQPIARIVLAGGGSRMKGLGALLKNWTQIPYIAAEPQQVFTAQKKEIFQEHDAPSFATAIGLGLRDQLAHD